MRKFALLLASLLLLSNCAGCVKNPGNPLSPDPSGVASGLSFILDRHGRYTGFDALPENYSPDQAVKDGYFVVVGSNDTNTKSILYGGGEHWQEFLEASGRGEKASMRKVLFIDGTPCYTDLFYADGTYRQFDSEREPIDRPYRYLRALTGMFGSPQKESTIYVLTDSMVLTFDDVLHSLFSSDLKTLTDIPYIWLGFTAFLEVSLDSTARYASYTDITPESLLGKGFAVLKDKYSCDGVICMDGRHYPLGIGFGGCGICDLKYYEGNETRYLLFTYSWGSGLHRSHVGVFDLTRKETVYTSDPFINIDIMLTDGQNGMYKVRLANVEIGEDFCDLTLTQGEQLAILTIDGDGIPCVVSVESLR